jgi:hypothetical protein
MQRVDIKYSMTLQYLHLYIQLESYDIRLMSTHFGPPCSVDLHVTTDVLRELCLGPLMCT